MATIKSYTDINQSRKLAEFLPLESADMFYTTNSNCEGKIIGLLDVPLYIGSDGFVDTEMGEIYAWSLTTLISVLPNEIITDKSRFECHYQIDIRKYDGGDNTTLYQIAYGNSRGLSGSWHDMINTGEKENLIDACVDMIENLHKLKMLNYENLS